MNNPSLSQGLKWILLATAEIFIVLLVFHAGLSLGERRAIDRFGPPRPGQPGPGGFAVGVPHGFLPDGHGAVGIISKITLPTISMAGRDGDVEEVIITASTTIEQGPQILTPADLTLGENIIVIGAPEPAGAQIQAKLIRVLPQPQP